MVIVKPNQYHDQQGKVHKKPLHYQVIEKREPFNYFDSIEDVIYFRPRLSWEYEPKAPYCAFRKNSFVTENQNMVDEKGPIITEKSEHEALVFVDNADKERIQARFIEHCHKYAYLKVNLLKSDADKYSDYNLHPHVITPCAPAVNEWLRSGQAFDPVPLNKKKYDTSFVGDYSNRKRRKHRAKIFAELRTASEKLKLRTMFGKRAPKGKYMSLLNNTKLCPSFKGGGYRCRRDWEILLTNSICLLDWILKEDEIVVVDMQPNEHFIWLERDIQSQLIWCLNNLDTLDEIRMKGYKLALDCFVYGKLNLEERFIRLFLLKPDAKICSVEELTKLENKMKLPGGSFEG